MQNYVTVLFRSFLILRVKRVEDCFPQPLGSFVFGICGRDFSGGLDRSGTDGSGNIGFFKRFQYDLRAFDGFDLTDGECGHRADPGGCAVFEQRDQRRNGCGVADAAGGEGRTSLNCRIWRPEQVRQGLIVSTGILGPKNLDRGRDRKLSQTWLCQQQDNR